MAIFSIVLSVLSTHASIMTASIAMILLFYTGIRKDMLKAKEIGMDAYHAEQRENMFLSTKIRGGFIPPLRWIAEIIRVFRFLCRLHRQ